MEALCRHEYVEGHLVKTARGEWPEGQTLAGALEAFGCDPQRFVPIGVSGPDPMNLRIYPSRHVAGRLRFVAILSLAGEMEVIYLDSINAYLAFVRDMAPILNAVMITRDRYDMRRPPFLGNPDGS